MPANLSAIAPFFSRAKTCFSSYDEAVVRLIVAISCLLAETPPAFELATIEISRPEEHLSIQVRGNRFTTTDTSLIDLLAFSYGLHAHQITGGPSWMETEKYDVLAEPEGKDKPKSNQLKLMVQNLLADRFQLAVHRETKELSVYSILVGKNGSKLPAVSSDPNASPGVGFQLGAMTVKSATMADFAGFLQRYVMDRPVVDQTKIEGRYDFSLRWTPDESQFPDRASQMTAPPGDADPPDLYTAIQQQLGLKLQAVKAPVDVIVVDHGERPSAN
jgi:uncharacterized protein (TIGR03435 family)